MHKSCSQELLAAKAVRVAVNYSRGGGSGLDVHACCAMLLLLLPVQAACTNGHSSDTSGCTVLLIHMPRAVDSAGNCSSICSLLAGKTSLTKDFSTQVTILSC
jgi:hypothetical protein